MKQIDTRFDVVGTGPLQSLMLSDIKRMPVAELLDLCNPMREGDTSDWKWLYRAALRELDSRLDLDTPTVH